MHSRLAPRHALDKLDACGDLFIELFRHGSLRVEMYRPIGADHQTPHTRDELYVIVAGTGDFVCAGDRQRFVAGEVLFVAAGIAHRFEHFSVDFCTWVFFYGPDGGERATK
jgi:hypothetical protein